MDDYVLRLYVSMDYAQGVDLIDCVAHLLYNWSHLSLLHGLCPLQLVEELSSCAALHNDEDMGLVFEVSVHLNDVGVVEVELYFQLANELLSDFLLFDKLFLDHLQSAHESCITLPN